MSHVGAGFSPHLELLHWSFEEFVRTRQKSSREAAAEQSPGLAALFAAYPGRGFNASVNPEGVAPTFNPFRVDSLRAVFPGLATKNAASPGL